MSKAKKKKTNKKKSTTKKKTTSKSSWLPWALAAAVLTILAMIPVFGTEFINYDDDLYATENPLILGFQIKQLFTEIYASQYSPLAMTLMAIQFKIFGVSAVPIKVMSVLLHAANVFLVFYMIQSLFKKKNLSFFVAALFGVCALQVESVAWLAASMKIGSYAFFFLLSLVAYIKYIDKKDKKWLGGSLVLFLMSCFCKEQAVALAPTLLAIDYLRNRSLLSKEVILEKIPFFIIALIFGIITLSASSSLENQQTIYAFGFGERFLLGLYALGTYFIKMILPYKLSFFYTYPIRGEIPITYYLMTLPVLAVLAGLYFAWRNNNKTVVFGLLFFAFNIGLTIFTQILSVRDVMMADRYVYIPAIGWFLLFGYFLNNFISKYTGKQAINYIGLAFILIMAFTTFQRSSVWKNSFTVFTDVIEKEKLSSGKINPYLALPYNNLGIWHRRNGQGDKAMESFNKAIERNKTYSKAFQNRGNIFFDRGNDKMALKDYNKGLALEPTAEKTLSSRGAVYARQGQYDKSLLDLTKAIEIDPNFVDALSNRALVYMQQNKYQEAINDFSRILSFQPNAGIYGSRGVCYGRLGQPEQALQDHNRAIQLDPNEGTFYRNRSVTYRSLGNEAQANQDLQKAQSLGK